MFASWVLNTLVFNVTISMTYFQNGSPLQMRTPCPLNKSLVCSLPWPLATTIYP